MDIDAPRGDKDPFHILILGETFQQPRITTAYVVTQLCYTLGMPEKDALEHAQFANKQGFSCLGTWKREECLDIGTKLLQRDIVCRVVPYAEGGGRPWQAKRGLNLPAIATNRMLWRMLGEVMLRKLCGSIMKRYWIM